MTEDGEGTRLDPRFRRPGKKTTKITVDKRFQAMFKDKDFVAPVRVDKYGRAVASDREEQDLRRFYRLDGEEDEGEVQKGGKCISSSDESVTSSDDSSSSEGSLSDGGEDFVMDEALAMHPLVVNEAEFCESTRRLALVNLDWDQIRAHDIFTLAHAFKPPTGSVLSVAIYPSKFGRERMARETIEGPPREIFQPARPAEKSESQSGSESESEPDPGDGSKDFNETLLRKYQLERLRYFYAVIECDSAETAYQIYRNCDGSELEKSTNFMDFRFIPDSVVFTEEEDGLPRETCTELPKKYHDRTDLVTSALQMSRVALTWDADDADRIRVTRRGASSSKFDAKEADLRAYLASNSGEDSSDGEAERVAQRYRALLLDPNNEQGDVFGRKGAGGDGQQDLQITFASALRDTKDLDLASDGDVDKEATFAAPAESQDSDEAAGRDPETLTPYEKYMERRKAKRVSHKQAAKAKQDAAKAAKKKHRLSGEESRLAELERERLSLLLDERAFDDEDATRASSKSKRHRQGRAETDELKATTKADPAFDVADPRFAAIYEEPSFALDPSHPSFKRTDSMQKIIKERQRRMHRHQ